MSFCFAASSTLLLLLLGEDPAGPPNHSAEQADSAERADEVDLGPILSARSMLEARVEGTGGEFAGNVNDIVLDVGNGRIESVVLAEGRERLSVPANRLDWAARDEEALRATLLPEGQENGAARKEESRANQPDKPLLVRIASRERIAVFDETGKQLGAIVDFGLAAHAGQIAYAVVELADGEDELLYPVPVAAFVVPEGDQHWLLEVPADVLAGTPTFKRGDWPNELSRAWVEYVHVRYGRPPLGGVQREKKSTE